MSAPSSRSDPSLRDPAPDAPANDSAPGAGAGIDPNWENARPPSGESQRSQDPGAFRQKMGAAPGSIRRAPPKAHGLPSRKVLMSGAVILGGLLAFALVTGLSPKERNHRETESRGFRAATPPESVRAGPSTYADLGSADAILGQSEAHPVLEPPLDPQFVEGSATDLGIGGRGLPPAGASNTSFSDRGASGVRGSRSKDYSGADAAGDGSAADNGDAAARTSPIAFGSVPQGGGGAYSAAGSRNSRNAMTSPSRLMGPSSNYVLQAGSVIPAALRTALNSDAPGRVVAQVTAPVYDSVHGEFLLVPQGARLLGTYESGVRYGDKRIRIVWNLLILPNGYSMDLGDMAAIDQSGAAGLAARVDDHIDRVAAASVISGALSTAANAAQDRDSSIFIQSIGDAAAQEAARVGGRIVDRELDVRPSLRVPAGAKVKVLIERDLVLRTYGQ